MAVRNFAQTDQMPAAAVDQRRQRRAADHVDAAADQRETFSGEIDDARRLGNASIEPGLHGVLIR